jgi:P-type Mg2+ transporter
VPQGYSKVDEMPFDFIRRRLSIVVKDKQQNHLLVCKGAVEEMLSISTHMHGKRQSAVELNDSRQ